MVFLLALGIVGRVGNSPADAAPRVCEMVMINGQETVVCPELEGGGGTDPHAKLIALTQFLDDMAEALADSVAEAGVAARLNLTEPLPRPAFPQLAAWSEVTLHDESGVLSSGIADVLAYPNTGRVVLMLELTEGDVTRTLNQGLSLSDGVLSSWGGLTIADAVSTTTLTGGWMYDPVSGVAIDPGSDPGFVEALAAMLRVPDIAGRGFSLGTIFTFVSNIVSMVVNYIIDVFIPYTPPLSCRGPSISSQSCDGVDIACDSNLSDACEMIDDIPGVSIAFKKCMKGRCACGGSTFGRLRIRCDLAGDCGGCLPPPPGQIIFGCSLASTDMWYCRDTLGACDCIDTVFHEMSHGCGAWDGLFGMPGESDRIGNWFRDELDNRFPNACAPARSGE